MKINYLLKFVNLFFTVCILIFIPSYVFADGYTKVYSGVTVTPSSIPQGQDFTVTFSIREENGESLTIAEMGAAILDASGNHLFDLNIRTNIYIPAYGTYTYTATGYTNSGYLSNPGTYKAVARGRVGVNWYDWSVTGSGVNPRTFYVVAPPPTIPSLNTPSNGTTLDDSTPDLSWSADNANYFHVQIDNNSSFSSPERENTNVGAFNWTPSSMSDGTYYWRVRSHGTDGSWSGWSSVWSFTIQTALPPTVPVLSTPSNGATLNDPTPDLSWSADNANYFHVQIDNNSNFSSPERENTNVGAFNWTPSSIPDGTYYWHVRSHGTDGSWSGWSSVWNFTIQTTPPPSVPTLLTPSNWSHQSSGDVSFDWTDASNAVKYRIKVSSNLDMTSPFINEYRTVSNYSALGLSPGTYYWQVAAYNSNDVEVWTGVWAFVIDQVVPPPSVPVLLTPGNWSHQSSGDVSFDWTDASNAVKYRIKVSSNLDMTSPFINEYRTVSNYSALGLSPGTYYWQVAAYNSNDDVVWTGVWAFVVDEPVQNGSVSGGVRDATNDNPIGGATVRLKQSGTTKYETTSASNGTYTIPDVTPGTYDLEGSKSGYQNLSYSVTVGNGEPITGKNLALQPNVVNGSVSGGVRDASNDNPLGGATVRLKQSGTTKYETTSASNGTYTIPDVTPGTYDLEGSKSGYQTYGYSVTVGNGEYLTGKNLALQPNVVDNPPYFQNISLPSSATIPNKIYFSGTANDDIGLQDIIMTISGPRGSDLTAFTESLNGVTSKNLNVYYFDSAHPTYANQAGSYTVSLTIKDTKNQSKSQSFNVTVSTGDTPDIINAPSNLIALALGSSVNLTWKDNSSNESGYRIERNTNEGANWNFLAIVGPNSDEYTDSGILLNRRYDYRIHAYIGNGNTHSEWVSYYAITLQTPANLNATALTPNQIKVTWHDNTSNETGFKLQRRIGSDGQWVEYDIAANSESYIDNDVNQGNTYYYRIRAYCNSSTSIPHYSSFSNLANSSPGEIPQISIETLDPLTNQLSQVLIENGKITQNIDLLANADNSLNRNGVATDGITKLLVRLNASPGDQIQISIYDDGQDNGALSYLDGSYKGTTLTLEGVSTSIGGRAFAIYHAPNVFYNSKTSLFMRMVTINCVNLSTGSTSSIQLKLMRPPVVLVHGLWSDPSAWDLFKYYLNDPAIKYIIHTANYRVTHSLSYIYNSNILPLTIDQALINFKKQTKLAAVKVDVVAHSMGGVLSRWYLAEIGTRDYKRSENYFDGDIRKLITIGTPHSGTQMANFLFPLTPTPILTGFLTYTSLADVLRDFDKSIDDGAVKDLAVPRNKFLGNGTDILNSRSEIQTRNHVIYTEIELGFNPIFKLIPKIGTVLSIVEFVTNVSLSVIFEGISNDVLVPTLSQQGGLGQNAQTYFPETSHFVQTERQNIVSEVDRLLELSPDAHDFDSNFDPVSLSISPQILAMTKEISNSLQYNQKIQTDSNIVQISYPPEGAYFSSGDVINVIAEGSGGELLKKVMFLTADTIAIVEVVPFEFHLTIPQNIVGIYTIGVLGKGVTGDNSYDKVNISIGSNTTLDSLSVEPTSILLTNLDGDLPLLVNGFFTDGIRRDITSSGTGTTYCSDNSSVVTVDNEGVLNAIKNGETTVIVANNGVSKVVGVKVNIFNPQTSISVDKSVLPQEFYLSQNYPNPFNQNTIITFQLPKRSQITIQVYNIVGQKVKTIFNENRNAGVHKVIWGGLNDSGQSVGSGLYFISMITNTYKKTIKVLYMR